MTFFYKHIHTNQRLIGYIMNTDFQRKKKHTNLANCFTKSPLTYRKRCRAKSKTWVYLERCAKLRTYTLREKRNDKKVVGVYTIDKGSQQDVIDTR